MAVPDDHRPILETIMTRRTIYYAEIDSHDPADLESRIKPLVKAYRFKGGRTRSERSEVHVYSVEDAEWLKTVGRSDIRLEHWSVEVDGRDYRHRLDGPAATIHPTYTPAIETWWLWGQSLGAERHAKAMTAGVADDFERFTEWRKLNR